MGTDRFAVLCLDVSVPVFVAQGKKDTFDLGASMTGTELAKGIYAVGCVDWSVRDFHSFEIQKGASYNAYLLQDEKTAVIDTVKAPFADAFLRNIREKTDLAKVDYIVCNHLEPDHAGALAAVVKAIPSAAVVCNPKFRSEVNGYFDTGGWNFHVLQPGETLSLGSRSLTFLNTPMVHWPESMVTYCPEEKILFSNDAFGQHIASSFLFDDQGDLDEILSEAKDYYANIVTPYGRQVLRTLDAAVGLDIQMIAPSHGFVWRRNLSAILDAYRAWASGSYAAKAVVLYDSMWESTAKMAEEIVRGAREKTDKVDVVLLHVRRNPLSRIAKEMLDAPCAAIGSATLNTQMMPRMAAVLNYVKGLKFREKSSFAFGSSGWGPGGPEGVAKWLEEVKYPVLTEPVKAVFRPTADVLAKCRAAGAVMAETALSKAEI